MYLRKEILKYMNKSYYRDLFIELKPFLKLSYFCKLADIKPSALSMFLKDSAYDHMISVEKLSSLENLIFNFMNNFA